MTIAMSSPSIDQINARFIEILPQLHSRIRGWTGLPIDEAVAEATTTALIACHSLFRRNRAQHIGTPGFFKYILRAVRSGRCAGSSQAGTDVMSPLGRRRHGMSVMSVHEKVSNTSTESDSVLYADILPSAARSIPDQVAFRIDFAQWFSRCPSRDRSMIKLLAAGECPSEVADRFGVSRSAVSQRRNVWRRSWQDFIAPPHAAVSASWQSGTADASHHRLAA